MHVRISQIGTERIDALRELWLALHRHHQGVSELQPLADDVELSWERRRADYLHWLHSLEAFILLAEDEDEDAPIGYAAVHLRDGPDDTWPLGDRWAEIYSLSVAPRARGSGVGTALLDAVDADLAARGISDLAVAVQVGNSGAPRFYERRGLRPGELILYRFGVNEAKPS